jgi:hypothetical protein
MVPRTKRTLLFVSLPAVIIAGILIYVIGIYSGLRAAVEVTTSDTAKVYVNGVYKGMTPLTIEDVTPGKQSLKLIPNNTDLLPYETPLSLAPQVKTIVRHKFSNKSYLSSTEIISFEKTVKSEASVTIVTKPADSTISFDGNIQKSSPLTINSNIGLHTVLIKDTNFETKSIDIETQPGYDLTLYIELAATSTLPSVVLPEQKNDNYVVIKNAPNKKAPVYESPNIYSEQLGQIASGKIVEVLDRDEKNQWIKIFSLDTTSGWVQQKYSSPSAQPATPP